MLIRAVWTGGIVLFAAVLPVEFREAALGVLLAASSALAAGVAPPALSGPSSSAASKPYSVYRITSVDGFLCCSLGVFGAVPPCPEWLAAESGVIWLDLVGFSSLLSFLMNVLAFVDVPNFERSALDGEASRAFSLLLKVGWA